MEKWSFKIKTGLWDHQLLVSRTQPEKASQLHTGPQVQTRMTHLGYGSPEGKAKRHWESIQESQKEPFKELAYVQLNFKISMDQWLLFASQLFEPSVRSTVHVSAWRIEFVGIR